MAYLYNLKYPILAKNYPKTNLLKKNTNPQGARSREEALVHVTVYVTTLYKDTPVKRLTFDIFER